MDPILQSALDRAADFLAQADALIVGAGAGMGVDSGLPDFRGRAGFWRAYPPLARLAIDFETIACPQAFRTHPRLAWGFYGHRLALYRATAPHEGFAVLLKLAAGMPHGALVFTSNVDGHFQRAGFADERVLEVHGSIHRLQCLRPCGQHTWPADGLACRIDPETLEWTGALPTCPRCDGLARPNILMFSDAGWVEPPASRSGSKWAARLRGTASPVVVEIGAGAAIPTVRAFCRRQPARQVRINPDYPTRSGERIVSIGLGARDALGQIAARLTWSASGRSLNL